VWDSKLLLDTGIELEPGKQYQINFQLSGDNGVGEFFLCKSQNIDDRYDETFTSASGQKSIVFTATGRRAYIGMQVGNLGQGNSVTLTIEPVKEYDASSDTDARVILAENCSYEIDSSDSQTTIKATDTGSNDTDVWDSKLLYFLGDLLEKGKIYAANFNLAGDNGVGEFFFCKKDNLDERYSFDNTAGDHTAKFAAEDSKLYAGMQLGTIGEGNDVTFNPSPDIMHGQKSIYGSWVTSLWRMEELVEHLVRWGIHPDKLITHRFQLKDVSEAYALMASGRCGKVAIVYPD
jgi:hypothetical protein